MMRKHHFLSVKKFYSHSQYLTRKSIEGVWMADSITGTDVGEKEEFY